MHPITYIVSDPDMLSGNKRIAVNHIATSSQAGLTPEEIASEYNLTLAQVHAALSYYHAHPGEIEQELRDEDAFVKKFMG